MSNCDHEFEQLEVFYLRDVSSANRGPPSSISDAPRVQIYLTVCSPLHASSSLPERPVSDKTYPEDGMRLPSTVAVGHASIEKDSPLQR